MTEFNFSPSKAFAGVALVGAVGLGLGSFTILEETERGIDYRLGEMVTESADQLRSQGFSLKMPFLTSVKKVDISLQQADYPVVSTYTRDNQVITASLTVMYKMPEGELVEIFKNNPDYLSKLETTVMDAAKSALGRQEAQNVAQNREQIMLQVTEETGKQVKDLLGIEVVAVKMPNFDFDDDFERAVSKAANAKAVLDEKRTELEQQRVEKDKTIVTAEGANEAKKLEADAAAYQLQKQKEAEAIGNLAIAQAEAEGFLKIVEAIGQENIATYLQTSKWDGSVPAVSGGGASTLVDMREIVPAIKAPKAPGK